MTEEEIKRWLPKVRALARWKANHCSALAEEIESYGVLGLYKAAAKYDPKRNVPFWSYAHDIVLGSMLDALRKMDWVDRRTRARIRRGEEPELRERFRFVKEPVDQHKNPEEMLLEAERRRLVLRAIHKLRAKERLVVYLYYADERLQRDIGMTLRVTEGRVSQLLLRARNKLRIHPDIVRCR